MDIETYARIKDVPILRAGTHTGSETRSFSDADLTDAVVGSNACLSLVKEAIVTGAYRDNPRIKSGPVPGLINLTHSRWLPETIKNAVKDVAVSFGEAIIDGIKWVTATFDDVPAEIAQFIRDAAPLRSVEIIPELFKDGQIYRNVIRSVAFLLPGEVPAVSGQTPQVAVELSHQPTNNTGDTLAIFTCLSAVPQPGQVKGESNRMESQDKTTAAQPAQPTPAQPATADAGPEITISMYQDMKAKLEQVAAQNASLQKAQADLQAKLMAEQAEREAKDVQLYCQRLDHEMHVAPAILERIGDVLVKTENSSVITFAAGNATPRQSIQNLVGELLTAAKEGRMFVPMGEQAKAAPQQQSTAQQRAEIRIAEFAAPAKAQAKNPQDAREVYLLQHQMAVAKYGDQLYQ